LVKSQFNHHDANWEVAAAHWHPSRGALLFNSRGSSLRGPFTIFGTVALAFWHLPNSPVAGDGHGTSGALAA
jgi:hypothetical protein